MTLAQFLNQNSFLLLSGFVLALAGGATFRRGLRSASPFGAGLLIALIMGVGTIWFSLKASSNFTNPAELTAALHNGRPVMIEVYSNR